PLQMEGMKLSIFLREDTEQKGLIRVSTRSVDDFPCHELCAEFFNGGGHKNAAGGSLRMTMEEAIEVVHKAVEKYETKLKDRVASAE
ncbi:MAG: bifunctional oligoribonuclease/PAP phosphatase NrnA, partial [Bacteroidaceae bacterium]|nr:bifunctional oligoribonuclease/PAP phosphatase NrnA [Bacteroidaceae bacterium]